jgi:hypothetical protein
LVQPAKVMIRASALKACRWSVVVMQIIRLEQLFLL